MYEYRSWRILTTWLDEFAVVIICANQKTEFIMDSSQYVFLTDKNKVADFLVACSIKKLSIVSRLITTCTSVVEYLTHSFLRRSKGSE